VHNSLAGQVAIELNLTGLNSTPVQREIAFESALWQVANELAFGRADLALAGAADELNQYLLAAGMRWGWWPESTPAIRPFGHALSGRQRALRGEGCAVFTLARPEQAAAPLAWVSGIRIGRWDSGPDLKPQPGATSDEKGTGLGLGLRLGSGAGDSVFGPGSHFDARAEAQWIRETLEREGVSLAELDFLLTGANGWAWLDRAFQAVGLALSELAGRQILCGAYKQCCGEHPSASAFGFLAAIQLVRGEIQPADCGCAADAPPLARRACRTVVLYTLSPTGTKGMCCLT
jgi:3-oxoacyl-(acyl-carrier-protein) synthase